MEISVISPQGTLLREEVSIVTLPGQGGSFSVLHNHAPLISILVAGKIRYRPPGGEDRELAIGGGIAEVKDDKVTVFV